MRVYYSPSEGSLCYVSIERDKLGLIIEAFNEENTRVFDMRPTVGMDNVDLFSKVIDALRDCKQDLHPDNCTEEYNLLFDYIRRLHT